MSALHPLSIACDREGGVVGYFLFRPNPPREFTSGLSLRGLELPPLLELPLLGLLRKPPDELLGVLPPLLELLPFEPLRNPLDGFFGELEPPLLPP